MLICCLLSVLDAARDKTLPRFASFRSDKVNTHVGPGKQYPLEWHYKRQYMPVEIIAEFDTWRQIRDVDGAVSWVHTSLLSGKRYGMVASEWQDIKSNPDSMSKTVAKIENGSIVRIKKIQGSWIQIESKIGNIKGWLQNNQIWGVYSYETSLN
ncbi:MAG: hypothetical protein CNLJKLNK_00554 [Holosporales bacterium]